MSGASEVFDLADDFGKAAAEIGRAVFDTLSSEGEAFAEDWADNAKQTAGVHGKHYPKSITSEAKLAFGVTVEVGPETGKKQGSMGPGFELGSRNQAPHLDGLRALGPASDRAARAVDATIGFLLP